MEEITQSHVCAICLAKSTYVCPRCGINYCSLSCYRAPKHAQCSESFYRDCCMDAMRHQYVDPSNKARMLDILRREASAQATGDPTLPSESEKPSVDELQSDDSQNDSDDLHSRFFDLNLESDDVDANTIWARLTMKERREFHRLLASGAVSNYLPTWEPWWLDSKSNIEEVPQNNGTNKANSHRTARITPMTLKKIFPSGKLPHSSIVFVLNEVVLAYAFLCRLYNGDCRDLVHEFLMRLYQLAPSLCSSSRPLAPRQCQPKPMDSMNRTVILTPIPARSSPEYTNLSQVVGALQLRLSDMRLPCSPQVVILLLSDLHALQSKEKHLTRVFAELIGLVHLARKQSQLADDTEATIPRDKLQAIFHKLRFLQACINPSDPDALRWQASVFPSLRYQTTVELCRQVSEFDPNTTASEPVRGPAAGPNWRQMIRSVRPNNEPSITVLDTQ